LEEISPLTLHIGKHVVALRTPCVLAASVRPPLFPKKILVSSQHNISQIRV
jgi:hypothetical protein